ncbi:MAG: hypothetical protein R3284_08270 [Rubricoccaceae bacterium]|nr:hypothetical protein [Rubricoccaceae bacterium]
MRAKSKQARNVPAHDASARGSGRRIGKTLLAVTIADPYAIVTTPLAVFLIVSFATRAGQDGSGPSGWTWQRVLASGAFASALVTFAILAFGHLAVVIWTAWRANNNNARSKLKRQANPERPDA